MAGATPVLERITEETQEEVMNVAPVQTEDEIHNSKISEIYAKLVNPETKLSDLKPAEPVKQAPVQAVLVAEPVVQQVAQPVVFAEPESRFVDSARTGASIFRADSPINNKAAVVEVEAQPVVAVAQVATEEETEDQRPTITTMQFVAENKAKEADGIVTNASTKRVSLTKHDKVVIAVVVSIIVALLALIIINSAIISGLNKDLNSLQSDLQIARNAYERVSNEISDYESNFDETLRALAESLGMVK